MVPIIGIEPITYALQVRCAASCAKLAYGGPYRARTDDLLLAGQAFSQLN